MNTPIQHEMPASKPKQQAKAELDGLSHVDVSRLVTELVNRGYQVSLLHVPPLPQFSWFSREDDHD
jgi:hypothetical protein